MKNIILFFLLSFTSVRYCNAQDVIVLKTGDEIISIVNEVGIDIIKYKKFENPDGPVYSIEKSKVFMIKYQNGTKDVFTEQKTEKSTPNADTVKVSVTTKTPVVVQAPEYLTYRQGVKKNNVNLTNAEVKTLYANCPEALQLYKNGIGLHVVASTLSWLEIGMAFLTAYTRKHLELVPGATPESIAKRGAINIGVMMVAGISCNIGGHQKKKKSVAVYNEAMKKAYEESVK